VPVAVAVRPARRVTGAEVVIVNCCESKFVERLAADCCPVNIERFCAIVVGIDHLMPLAIAVPTWGNDLVCPVVVEHAGPHLAVGIHVNGRYPTCGKSDARGAWILGLAEDHATVARINRIKPGFKTECVVGGVPRRWVGPEGSAGELYITAGTVESGSGVRG